MPDVAAHERYDIRLPEQRDRIVDPTRLEPAFGDLDRHGALPQTGSLADFSSSHYTPEAGRFTTEAQRRVSGCHEDRNQNPSRLLRVLRVSVVSFPAIIHQSRSGPLMPRRAGEAAG